MCHLSHKPAYCLPFQASFSGIVDLAPAPVAIVL
jgi:hypothetical protein